LTAGQNKQRAGNPVQKMGFWRCWSLSVGVMIGSGIFMLPAVLAPFGYIALLGWLVTSAGVIALAAILGRLANRSQGTGGPYIYCRDSFGNLPGFLIAWGYWISVTIAITAVAMAFSGYLGTLIPALGQNNILHIVTALVLIWSLTAINIRGVSEASWVQLTTTIAKLIPLFLIIAWGFFSKTISDMPPPELENMSIVAALSTTALLTMWAFIGIEAAVIPSEEIQDAQITIPKAVLSASIFVALTYILVTMAVMMLVPVPILANSDAPLIDAAGELGGVGPLIVAIGALIATAGSLNGNILIAGQMPMAVAMDGLAPKFLARLNAGHAPAGSLLLSSSIASLLLFLNVSDSLIESFTFLITISTLCVLLPYGVSALAELKYSWRRANAWVLLALLTMIYAVLAAYGSGLKVLLWGAGLMAVGLPVFYFGKRQAV